MIKHIQPLPVSAATGFVSEMYKQIRREFGFVGDIFIMHSLSPPLLAGVWAALRETEIVGAVPRGIKEAVAAAVAKANQCSFCVDAHTTMLSAAGNKEAAQKIIEDQADGISDEKMRSIVKWALALVFSSSIRKSRKPGESIVFLSEAILPNDLRWAKSHPIISRAFACFAAAADAAGKSTLSEEIRSHVQHYIDDWDGKEPGLSRNWVEHKITTLSGPSKISQTCIANCHCSISNRR